MADLNLEELERLHEAATSAPWFIEGTHNDYAIMGNRTGSQGGWSIADNVFDLDARRKDAARQERDANLVIAVRNALPELLAKARLAEKAAEFLRAHINASKSELDELRKEFGMLTCPHCDEPLVESEGVEGPHGNLWHYRCLESWREDV